MSRCDIIIPVWNQPGATRDCIDSIVKYTGCPYRLVIIDNGSDAATRDYLIGLKDDNSLNLTLIRNDENLGFVRAVNQGIKLSDAPYMCITNNDTIATEGWLEEMIDVMKAHPEIGLLNPSSNTFGQVPFKNETIDNFAFSLKRFRGQFQELYTCRGFCMLLRREVIERVGLFDEIYGLGYFEETDYCKRAQSKGFKAARAKAAYVYHKERVSFNQLKDRKDLFAKNEKIFFERWGRTVRVGYFIDRINSKDRIDDIAINIARDGHQILIFLKRGLEWPVSLEHFDIRRFELNPAFFGCLSIYKILKRKKKKKLDIVLTDNRFFGNFLKMCKIFHGSDVMVSPDRKSLLEFLKRKSKEF